MRLNGARAICQSLVEEGVSTIFGLPGGAIMPLYDVLPEFPQLRHILVRPAAGDFECIEGFEWPSKGRGRTDA